MKIVWSSFDEAMDGLERLGKLCLYIALVFVCLRVYTVTLPKVDSEVDEVHRASTETALTMMGTREMTAAELKAIPVTQGKINAAVDSVTAMAKSGQNALDALTRSQQELTAQGVQSLKTLNENVAQIKPILVQTQNAVAGIAPIEKQTTAALEQTTQTMASIKATVSDPAIHGSLQNVQTTTGYVAEMAKMGRDKLHSILHPKWPSQVGGWVERIGVDAGKVFAP